MSCDTSVTIQEEDTFSICTTEVNQVTKIDSLSDIGDVDLTDRTDGSVLVYKASTNRWIATTILDQQIIDCGEY